MSWPPSQKAYEAAMHTPADQSLGIEKRGVSHLGPRRETDIALPSPPTNKPARKGRPVRGRTLVARRDR